jgi:hypothetical protein
MLGPLSKSGDRKPDSLFNPVIVSLVGMSILFGFGLATLVFHLEHHASPDGVLPGLILSFAGICVQFGMLRLLIRHRTQPSD